MEALFSIRVDPSRGCWCARKRLPSVHAKQRFVPPMKFRNWSYPYGTLPIVSAKAATKSLTPSFHLCFTITMKLVFNGLTTWPLNKSNTWRCMRMLFVNGSKILLWQFFTSKARQTLPPYLPRRWGTVFIVDVYKICSCVDWQISFSSHCRMFISHLSRMNLTSIRLCLLLPHLPPNPSAVLICMLFVPAFVQYPGICFLSFKCWLSICAWHTSDSSIHIMTRVFLLLFLGHKDGGCSSVCSWSAGVALTSS